MFFFIFFGYFWLMDREYQKYVFFIWKFLKEVRNSLYVYSYICINDLLGEIKEGIYINK